jgi:hypothetical protein
MHLMADDNTELEFNSSFVRRVKEALVETDWSRTKFRLNGLTTPRSIKPDRRQFIGGSDGDEQVQDLRQALAGTLLPTRALKGCCATRRGLRASRSLIPQSPNASRRRRCSRRLPKPRIERAQRWRRRPASASLPCSASGAPTDFGRTASETRSASAVTFAHAPSKYELKGLFG